MIITFTIDTDNQSDDFVGELLRDQIFNQKKGYGCYSTFELNPGFRNVDKSNLRIQKFWRYLIDEAYQDMDDIRDEIERTTIVENDKFIAMWYWDGDGTLLIYLKENNVLYLNTDCKKDYNWKKYCLK